MLHKNETDQPQSPIRIAIVDFDNCAYVDTAKYPGFLAPVVDDYLSPELMTTLKNGNYEEIYGCTHRRVLKNTTEALDSYVETELSKISISSFMASYKLEGSGMSKEEYYLKVYQPKYSSTINAYETKPDEVGCSKIKYFTTIDPKTVDLSLIQDVSGADPKSHFTTRIAENLEKATGIKVTTVSTIYDRIAPDGKIECGYGFREIATPLEKTIFSAVSTLEEKDFSPLSAENLKKVGALLDEKSKISNALKEQCDRLPTIIINEGSKNSQLRQIITDINRRHPGRQIIVDFFDDKEAILENASKLRFDGVTINTFLHDGNSHTTPKVFPVKVPAALPSLNPAMLRNFLLASSPDASATTAATKGTEIRKTL